MTEISLKRNSFCQTTQKLPTGVLALSEFSQIFKTAFMLEMFRIKVRIKPIFVNFGSVIMTNED